MAIHSVLGASSFDRWSNCPGSVALIATVPPQPESSYAKDGSKSHAANEHYLKHGEFPKGTPLEMVEAGMVYIKTLFDDERAAYQKSSVQRFIERRVDLSAIYPGCFGTSDCIDIYPALKFMRVYDYKYGVGVAVDVEDNGQLKYYALGALLEFKGQFEIAEVELVIVQPRATHKDGPIRRWKISAEELLSFGQELELFAMATENPNADLVPGDHCGFCPAKHACPALHKQAVATAQMEFKPEFSYDPAKLSKALSMVPQVKAWIKGVEEFAEREAFQGRIPPGYKLVESRGRRVWPENTDATSLLLEFGLEEKDALEPPALRSPAQIEKLLSKEDREHLKTLTVFQKGSITLVPESDKRPAARPDATTEFTALPTT